MSTSHDFVVIAQRGLIRSLLGEFLRERFALRQLALCSTFEEALVHARTARFLLCDATGFSLEAVAVFTERLRNESPGVGVFVLDDSDGTRDVADVVTAIRALARPPLQPHESLTPLEYEVMLAVASGGRNADIARRMRRSSKTVEKHRANAMRKLGFHNVAQLTAYALRHRLLDSAVIFERGIP